MVHGEFWSGRDGMAATVRRRRESALWFRVPGEPGSKRARRGSRRKAREVLAHAFDNDSLVARAREMTNWPKPRAPLAVDVYATSSAANPPRIDAVVKWLLDELAGRAYADDRQVKLLFARMSHVRDRVRWDLPGGLVREPFWPDPPPGQTEDPHLDVRVRPISAVHADVRMLRVIEASWDRFDDDREPLFEDPLRANEYRENLVAFLDSLRSESDARERTEHTHGLRELAYHDQTEQQQVVDRVFSRLFSSTRNLERPTQLMTRGLVSRSPYLFDLGLLPGRGDSGHFQQQLLRMLEDRAYRFPALFPLRSTAGISLVLFEGVDRSKDLDNLVRQAIPSILDIVRPPRMEVPPWIGTEEVRSDQIGIPFIEVAALPASETGMKPGSLVLGLASGQRYDSWWSRAESVVNDVIGWPSAR